MAAHARRWVLSELRANLAKELDFRLEAVNAQRLAAAFAGRRGIAVPQPVPEVHCMGACPVSCASACKSCQTTLEACIGPTLAFLYCVRPRLNAHWGGWYVSVMVVRHLASDMFFCLNCTHSC